MQRRLLIMDIQWKEVKEKYEVKDLDSKKGKERLYKEKVAKSKA